MAGHFKADLSAFSIQACAILSTVWPSDTFKDDFYFLELFMTALHFQSDPLQTSPKYICICSCGVNHAV